ncbi:MAG: hypothetical protein Udaeo2_13320 [Candidatus Udaeobacter sp.]|jgi:serine/threonine protein kinase|nr:MAG: hypothetical protein Udaeo2_13320 [Candidatus Udaeobacter sp.]
MSSEIKSEIQLEIGHVLFMDIVDYSTRLIDFEGACLIDETDVLPWGSPNYVPPIYHGKFSRRPGTMEDDYALGVIAFQFATGEFPPLGSRRRHALFRCSGCPDFLRIQIESLLRY